MKHNLPQKVTSSSQVNDVKRTERSEIFSPLTLVSVGDSGGTLVGVWGQTIIVVQSEGAGGAPDEDKLDILFRSVISSLNCS